MLKLVRLPKGQWLAMSPTQEIYSYGSFDDALNVVESLEIEFSELLFALDEMNNRADNTADFGINGTFIFSSRDPNVEALTAALSKVA